MSEQPELAVARAGDCGADAVHDLVCFALGDLDELVLQVAALSRDQKRSTLPDEIRAECFISSPAGFEVNTPENSRRPLTTAQIINDRIVGDFIGHFCLSLGSRECLWRRVELVPQQQLSPERLGAPYPRTHPPAPCAAARRSHA